MRKGLMNPFEAYDTVTGLYVTDVCGELVRDCSEDQTIPVRIQSDAPQTCAVQRAEVLSEFELFSDDDRTSEVDDTLVARLLRIIRRL